MSTPAGHACKSIAAPRGTHSGAAKPPGGRAHVVSYTCTRHTASRPPWHQGRRFDAPIRPNATFLPGWYSSVRRLPRHLPTRPATRPGKNSTRHLVDRSARYTSRPPDRGGSHCYSVAGPLRGRRLQPDKVRSANQCHRCHQRPDPSLAAPIGSASGARQRRADAPFQGRDVLCTALRAGSPVPDRAARW